MNEQQSIPTRHSTPAPPAATGHHAPASPRAVEHRRQQVIALLRQHTPIRQIAAATGYSPHWVRAIIARYYSGHP